MGIGCCYRPKKCPRWQNIYIKFIFACVCVYNNNSSLVCFLFNMSSPIPPTGLKLSAYWSGHNIFYQLLSCLSTHSLHNALYSLPILPTSTRKFIYSFHFILKKIFIFIRFVKCVAFPVGACINFILLLVNQIFIRHPCVYMLKCVSWCYLFKRLFHLQKEITCPSAMGRINRGVVIFTTNIKDP